MVGVVFGQRYSRGGRGCFYDGVQSMLKKGERYDECLPSVFFFFTSDGELSLGGLDNSHFWTLGNLPFFEAGVV